jgi:SAM-dependent methyltransferase
MGSAVSLVCPSDRGALALADGQGAYVCTRCGSRFPVKAGVVRFLPDADQFYEGRNLNSVRYLPRSERPPFCWPLWLMCSGYVWAVRKHIPEGRTVIDMGCASGVRYYAERYRLIGLDLSGSSLEQVSSLYASCLQADATKPFPIPDGTVDGIISSFFWEHIPPELKPAVLAECHRALAPGGKLVFLYDIASENPLYRRLRRRDPALFKKLFVDREGHLGWESVEANRALFEVSGFRVLENLGREKTPFIQAAMYERVVQWPGWTRPLARAAWRLSRPPWFHVYNGMLRVLDGTLGRLLPPSWSRIVITVCEKA